MKAKGKRKAIGPEATEVHKLEGTLNRRRREEAQSAGGGKIYGVADYFLDEGDGNT